MNYLSIKIKIHIVFKSLCRPYLAWLNNLRKGIRGWVDVQGVAIRLLFEVCVCQLVNLLVMYKFKLLFLNHLHLYNYIESYLRNDI